MSHVIELIARWPTALLHLCRCIIDGCCKCRLVVGSKSHPELRGTTEYFHFTDYRYFAQCRRFRVRNHHHPPQSNGTLELMNCLWVAKGWNDSCYHELNTLTKHAIRKYNKLSITERTDNSSQSFSFRRKIQSVMGPKCGKSVPPVNVNTDYLYECFTSIGFFIFHITRDRVAAWCRQLGYEPVSGYLKLTLALEVLRQLHYNSLGAICFYCLIFRLLMVIFLSKLHQFVFALLE